jgi:Protein of unknown function (DUF1490)
MLGGFVGKAAGVLASGVVGAAAYDGVRRLARSDALHATAVRVTSWGMRGARAAEAGAERARLATADIVSEARERIGEESPPPATAAPVHDHAH